MDCDEEKMDDFLPKNPTIGKRRRSKSKVKGGPKKTAQKNIIPAMNKFEDSDPFANAKEFIAFYRSIVRSYAGSQQVGFPAHGADRQYASVVMDELIDAGRECDSEFLRAWIKYYAEFKLKDDDFGNLNKTSIRSFSKTLGEYQTKHIDTL